MKKILEKAKVEIQKEMDQMGFIDDSDNCDRFLDNLAMELTENTEEIDMDIVLEKIKDIIMVNYSRKGVVSLRGDYSGCYYKGLKDLVKWAGCWQENSIIEAYAEFIDLYNVDITLEKFTEVYEIDIKNYEEIAV